MEEQKEVVKELKEIVKSLKEMHHDMHHELREIKVRLTDLNK